MREGVDVYSGLTRYLNCHGMSMCGECRVHVTKGMENLSKPGFVEKTKLSTMFATLGHEKEIRLSCCCQVQGDVTVETCPEFNISGEVFWKKEYPNK